MKWMKITLPAIIFAAGIGGMQLIVATAQEDTEQEKVDTRPTVAIESLTPIDYAVAIQSFGEMTPLESTNLASQIAGEVEYWNPNFIPGGLVKRGDVLFKIEKDAYQAALLLAQANLSSAQAQLIQEQALADVARQEAKTLPSARVTDLYLRKPQVMSAQASVKSAQAQLRIAQRDLDNTEVKAPYDALVVQRNIGVGDYVNTGMVAAVLHNIETAEITFPIAGFDNAFLPEELVATNAKVYLPSNTHVRRDAIIHRDIGLVDDATRMSHLVARIEDPYAIYSDDPVFKFGSYVEVSFTGTTLTNVYKISQELITGNSLWVLDDNNKMHAQPVTVLKEENEFFIVEANFATSKMVVTIPEYPLEGMEVRVIDGSNNREDEPRESLVAQSNNQ